MSAYDWKKCPICQNEKENLKIRLKKERKTLSNDEYEDLLDKLETIKNTEEESEEQVRHDQEVWLDDETQLMNVNISMGCQVCGAEWELNTKIKPLIPKEEE